MLPPETRDRLIARAAREGQTDPSHFEAFLQWYWPIWARPEQLEPEGNWAYWLILAGRGYGKTRAGAEWIRKSATSGRFQYVNIIGATADDARDIMVEGESGILAVCPNWERAEYLPTKRRLDWPNGAKTLIFTADEPERLRGKQHQRLWCLISGTLVRMADGSERPIEQIQPGDEVAVGGRVTAVAERYAPLVRVRFGDDELVGSGEHPVRTGRGWIPLGELFINDTLCLWDDHSTRSGVQTTEATPTAMSEAARSIAIAESGKGRTGRFSLASRFIIGMADRAMTGRRTFASSLVPSISGCITIFPAATSALVANGASQASLAPGRSSARTAELLPPRRCAAWWSRPVPTAEKSSKPAEVGSVVSAVSILGVVGRVHNLTTERGVFYAGGVLTHNCDELASWRYSDAWDQAMFGLRLGPDPKAVITTTPKPRPILRDLLERPGLMISKGTTYENQDNLAPQFFEEIIRKYEGTRLGQQELNAELLLDEGLAYRVEEGVHVVPPFFIPEHWERFESMDYGRNHPTAWPIFAVDHDGNVVVFDMYYSPGLVTDHVAAIHVRRKRWWPPGGSPVCYGPPDIRSKHGFIDPKGREISVETEFADKGIAFATAQTDRRAGYTRIEEMLRPRGERYFPEWHPRSGEKGAPYLYVFDTGQLQPLVDQLREAPLEDPASAISRFPGEAVEQAWESDHGHAHAALRYGLMSRPGPSAPIVDLTLDDDRAEALRQSFVKEREQEEERDGEFEFDHFPAWDSF